MAPKLYMSAASPAVRSVLLTAKAIGLNLEEIHMDLKDKREHLTPEFLKINPQHTVPTLDDDGYVLWDSHAITPYLVDKYAKNDSLFPKDLKKRATVNQRLHFNNCVLAPLFTETVFSVFREGKTKLSSDTLREVDNILGFLDKFLEHSKYVAGDDLTIADFHILTTITVAELFVPIDPKKFQHITAWLDRMKALPYYDVNEKGLQLNREMAKAVGVPTTS